MPDISRTIDETIAAGLAPVLKRTGSAPPFPSFDLFLHIDNEKGEVTEFPAAAELFPAAAA